MRREEESRDNERNKYGKRDEGSFLILSFAYSHPFSLGSQTARTCVCLPELREFIAKMKRVHIYGGTCTFMCLISPLCNCHSSNVSRTFPHYFHCHLLICVLIKEVVIVTTETTTTTATTSTITTATSATMERVMVLSTTVQTETKYLRGSI